MSSSRLAVVVALCGVGACSSSKPAPAPQPDAPMMRTGTVIASSTGTVQTRRISTGDSFTPKTGAAAIAAFVPHIAPLDSGGECSITRTGGNGATVASAGFPRLVNSHTLLSITFDSSGRVIRFSERRGSRGTGPLSGLSAEQRDSAMMATMRSAHTTTISFDYAIDQAIVLNQGGGRPTDAVLGPVRSFENLEKLGPPRARMERLRRLCGV